MKDFIKLLKLKKEKYYVSKQKYECCRRETHSATLGLRDEEVNYGKLDQIPNSKDNVCLPANLLHGNGPGVLVQHTGGVDSQVREGHALGTHLKGKNLDGVQGLEGSDTNREDGTKDEDHSQGGLGGMVVRVDLGAIIVELSSPRHLKSGRGNRHSEPNDGAAQKGEEEQGATTNLIDQQSTSDGPGELLAVVDQSDVCLLNSAFVPSSIEHRSEEVRKHSVTGPLAKNGDYDVAREAVDCSAVAEQCSVVPPALVGTVHVEELLILAELECNPSGLRIAVAVVFGEDLFGLFLLVVDI